jgi:signal transduction histidine kinase
MLRIISGILDLERIRLSSEMWELCDVNGMVQGAVDEIAHLARHNSVELKVDVAAEIPSFLGDAEQFQRVLVNLLENAIKFTLTDDGVVEMAAYQEDQQIVFRVKDNGVGIPAQVRDRVFDRFYRGGQPGVEHITGSGLGLSLVRSIVEHHRGKVWLTSEEGVGTTFFVAVPVVS